MFLVFLEIIKKKKKKKKNLKGSLTFVISLEIFQISNAFFCFTYLK